MAKRTNILGATRIRPALAALGLGAVIALGAAGTAMADGVTDTGSTGTSTTQQVPAPAPTPTPTDDTDWNSTGS
ncbi:hypothetical protein [Streptomyces roseicoloratus]|uniref:hypothetical protein n=1 Tax=Streptomyces roseicoloratus TaxID=2508722 RepID=UPI001009EDDE|nr:hypothetical protein [Streptomyces roseicoloratus]